MLNTKYGLGSMISRFSVNILPAPTYHLAEVPFQYAKDYFFSPDGKCSIVVTHSINPNDNVGFKPKKIVTAPKSGSPHPLLLVY